MGRIQIIKGDITTINCDAIVNCANTSLLGGSGLDGLIHRKGGKSILHECQTIRNRQGGCKVTEAVITSGGNLPSKYVIHTVGPTWNGGENNEISLLVNTYLNCLNLAIKYSILTIAFPNISTGRYRFPKAIAASIAIQTVREYLVNNESIEQILFSCFDDENYRLYTDILP